jgi:hypothetical protein
MALSRTNRRVAADWHKYRNATPDRRNTNHPHFPLVADASLSADHQVSGRSQTNAPHRRRDHSGLFCVGCAGILFTSQRQPNRPHPPRRGATQPRRSLLASLRRKLRSATMQTRIRTASRDWALINRPPTTAADDRTFSVTIADAQALLTSTADGGW